MVPEQPAGEALIEYKYRSQECDKGQAESKKKKKGDESQSKTAGAVERYN